MFILKTENRLCAGKTLSLGDWSHDCVINVTPKKSNLRSVVLKLEHAPESPGGLVKAQIPGPTRVPDPAGLGWNPRVCIPPEFPGEAGLGTTR